MNILYKDTKNFDENDLKELFESVQWRSAKLPQRLKKAFAGSDTVFSAWDDNHPVGLINAIDDGEMTAYIHFLLVDPIYQGKGIGKELLLRVMEKYKDYVYINLSAEHSGLISFYEKCGLRKSDGSMLMSKHNYGDEN